MYMPKPFFMCRVLDHCTSHKLEHIGITSCHEFSDVLIGFQPQRGSEMELNYGTFLLGFRIRTTFPIH